MSSAPVNHVPSPDDAEKGVASAYPGEIAITFTNEKGDLTTTDIVPVPAQEKVQKPAPKPASKPAKREVSKWILWQLWFNTYR